MFIETRQRLALWYTVLTAILLILFATGFYFYVRNTLIERIDDTLHHITEIVENSLVIDNVSISEGKYKVNLEASFPQNINTKYGVDDDHIDLEWFSPNGQLLWSNLTEQLPIPLHFNYLGETVSISPDFLLRQVTTRIEIGRYVLGYLRVSHPWFEVTKPIRQLIFDLILGISLMIISAAAIGWFLSGIAIKPVRDSYQSLKQFTADASHELRNPIATIGLNISMLLSYPEYNWEVQKKQLLILERLTQRLGNLVNDLLFLARADSGIIKSNFQIVPLDALLIEVIEEQRIIAQQKKIDLSINIETPKSFNLSQEITHQEDNTFVVNGDWNQLARVFTNLISNALNYTKANNQKSQVNINLNLIKKYHKHYLQIDIKDNGIGIRKEDLSHIFNRFYRIDNSRSKQDQILPVGTGLGLAISQAIIANHQGEINVKSIINEGSTFTVILPKFNQVIYN